MGDCSTTLFVLQGSLVLESERIAATMNSKFLCCYRFSFSMHTFNLLLMVLVLSIRRYFFPLSVLRFKPSILSHLVILPILPFPFLLVHLIPFFPVTLSVLLCVLASPRPSVYPSIWDKSAATHWTDFYEI